MIQQFEGAGALVDFANEWDVGAVSPDICVVKRMWSIYQEHDQLMRRVAVPIERNDTPETLARKVDAMEKKRSPQVQAGAEKNGGIMAVKVTFDTTNNSLLPILV